MTGWWRGVGNQVLEISTASDGGGAVDPSIQQPHCAGWLQLRPVLASAQRALVSTMPWMHKKEDKGFGRGWGLGERKGEIVQIEERVR